MGYLAVFLDLSGRCAVVVGGGEVAERRVRALLRAGADVTVVAPALTTWLAERARSGAIKHRQRDYRSGDVSGCALAYAAAGDPSIQRAVAEDCARVGVPLNVADVPELCSFISPAVVRRGALQIAVSTSGASPALARHLRLVLEDRFGPEYGVLTEIMRAARQQLRAGTSDAADRAKRLANLLSSDLAGCLRRRDFAAVDQILAYHLGLGMSLRSMGLGTLATDAPAADT